MSMDYTPPTPQTTPTPLDPGIRLPQDWELDDLVVICKELHHENGQFPLNERKLREGLLRGIKKEIGIIGVIGEPGKIEAMMVMMISCFWYTDEHHLEELFSYVRPNFRRTTHAKRLVEWAKACAEDLGMKLFIGIVSDIRTEAKVRLYRRQLGSPVGAYFIYNRKKNTEH